MTIPLKFVYSAVKGEFSQSIQAAINPIAQGATGAVKDAADFVKTEGRSRIRAAGFGVRWQNAFRVNVYPKRGVSVDAALFAYHRIPYAGVFESGITISGNPMLWLPLPNIPLRFGGNRLTPALFVQKIGPLHSVNIPGKPPMLAAYISSAADPGKITVRKLKSGALRRVQRGPNSVISVPIFYGISTVQLKARFQLDQVFDRAKSNLGTYYLQRMKGAK